MELSVNAILLLRHVLSYTGEKEVGPKGEEVPALRTMNGVESSQRRHFTKNTEGLISGYNQKTEEIRKSFEEFRKEVKEKIKTENPKLAEETDEKYDEKITELMNTNKDLINKFIENQKELTENAKKVYTIEINEKTLNVVKKYYTEFGDKTGYTAGDDDIVGEINVAFGLAVE